MPARRVLHLATFLAALGVFTWKLLEPRPVPEVMQAELSGNLIFILSKCLHAAGYAVLAVLGVSLPRTARGRWAVAGVLVLHGAATEALQYGLEWGRTGKVTDVLIDWAGIAAGTAAVFWHRRRRDVTPPAS